MSETTRSKSTLKLDKALFAIRGELDPVKKTSDNPFFKSKYADLTSSIRQLDPVFRKHGVLVLQGATETYDNNPVTLNITTELIHVESGEFRLNVLTLPLKSQDPQQLGSAVTYGRRYLWQLVAGAEVEDDDGNTAVFGSKAPLPTKTAAPAGKFKGKAAPLKEASKTPAKTSAVTSASSTTSEPKASPSTKSLASSGKKKGTASKFGKKKAAPSTTLPKAVDTSDGAFSFQPKD